MSDAMPAVLWKRRGQLPLHQDEATFQQPLETYAPSEMRVASKTLARYKLIDFNADKEVKAIFATIKWFRWGAPSRLMLLPRWDSVKRITRAERVSTILQPSVMVTPKEFSCYPVPKKS